MRIPILSLPIACLLALVSCFLLWLIGSMDPQIPEDYREQTALTFTTAELQKAVIYAPYLPKLRRIRLLLQQSDSELPAEALKAFQQITRLDIQGREKYCSLKALINFPTLQVLRVEGVAGKHNIDYIGRLRWLKELHLIHCYLEKLPPLDQLDYLETLDLSGNTFTLEYYLEEFMALTRLRALRLDQNPIEQLPSRLLQHPTLAYLSLQNCQIKEITGEWGLNSSLRELYLSHNALITVPAGLLTLSKLEQLDLGYNKIHLLPDIANKHLGIRGLNLRYNRLGTVPIVLMQMDQLEWLELQYNLIRTIPSFINNHPSLSDIVIGVNGLMGNSRNVDQANLTPLEAYSVLWDSPMHK